MRQRLHPVRGVVIAAVLICLTARAAPAENIDPNNQGDQYAWGENIGWINFKPDQGPGVTVTATAVTGFAWAENVGWLNLSPADGGVTNQAGHLSGFAWGENVGWVNFGPTGAGVFISPNGQFHGFAWGENVGWINFDVPGGVRTGFVSRTAAPAAGPLGLLLVAAVLVALGYRVVRRGWNAAGRPVQLFAAR